MFGHNIKLARCIREIYTQWMSHNRFIRWKKTDQNDLHVHRSFAHKQTLRRHTTHVIQPKLLVYACLFSYFFCNFSSPCLHFTFYFISVCMISWKLTFIYIFFVEKINRKKIHRGRTLESEERRIIMVSRTTTSTNKPTTKMECWNEKKMGKEEGMTMWERRNIRLPVNALENESVMLATSFPEYFRLVFLVDDVNFNLVLFVSDLYLFRIF